MAEPESSPIAQRFAQLASEHASQLALTFRGEGNPPSGSESYDFAQFWRRVQRVTGHLQSTWDVKPGDRVAWLGLNHELQLVTLVACARLGAIFMPMNFRLAAAELQTVLDDAQPRLLVHDALHAPIVENLRGQGLRATRLEALIETPSPRGLGLPHVDEHAPVLLVYTSGTTGKPKGALHTQAALLANARASISAHGFDRDDKVLTVLPLFHIGGLCIQTLPALLAGVPVVLHARFEPGAWLKELRESRPSLSLLVPATLRAVIEHPEWRHADLNCLRGIMTGSSVVPIDFLQAFHRRAVPVGQVYGSTETGPVSIVLKLQDAIAHAGAVGWPQPEAKVKLINEQGMEVQSGQTGEVCIRAPNLMCGYWNASHSLGQGLIDGWFHTGDLGQRDAHGCITIVGRSKDMIISGGENIYPAEIENALVMLPGVAECAVVGMPDARWGEVPVLALVRSGDAFGAELTQAALLEHLRSRIARFKLPREIVFLDALPKSALGKVQRGPLQDLLRQDTLRA